MKHPLATYYLFFFEMWERFSYCGMRAILTLYMIQQLGLSYNDAFITYGAFTTFVYMTSIIGGFFADKFFGHQESIKHGAVLIILGHIVLSAPNIYDNINLNINLYLGLSFLSIGTGFFKPNVPILFGNLYDKNDIRRDSGFTVFVFGINLGSFLASISVPIIAQKFGWHYGFSVASIGMGIGLIIFIHGEKKGVYQSDKFSDRKQNYKNSIFIYFLSIIMLPFLGYMFINPNKIIYILGIITFFYITYFLYSYKTNSSIAYKESHNINTISIILLVCMIFYAFFEQTGSSMVMFIENFVDRKVLGFVIPSGSYKSLNPLFIFLLAPVFAKLWYILNRIDQHSRLLYVKFSFSFLLIGLGFGFLPLAIYFACADCQISMIWIVAAYFFFTIGDLCISPIALSAMTKYASGQHSGTLVGGFYLSISFANYISSVIATSVNTDINQYLILYKTILLICIFLFLLILAMAIVIAKIKAGKSKY